MVATTKDFEDTLKKYKGYYDPKKIRGRRELKTNADGYNAKHQKIWADKRNSK